MLNPSEGLRAQGELSRMADGWIGPPSEQSDLPEEGKVAAPRRSDELDDEFVARQRARLEEMMRGMLRARSEIEVEEKEWDESGRYARPHAEDVSAHLLSDEVDTALDRRLAHRLMFVRRALQKIEEGTYGICDATGEPIPRGRLEAVPEATYTLEAQKRLEGRT
jgi:DnaK suppressor protein